MSPVEEPVIPVLLRAQPPPDSAIKDPDSLRVLLPHHLLGPRPQNHPLNCHGPQADLVCRRILVMPPRSPALEERIRCWLTRALRTLTKR